MRTRTTVAALAFFAASVAPTLATAQGDADGGVPRGGGLKPFEGKVIAVDRKATRVTIEGKSGSFPVAYDRDTSVYLEEHTGTPLDLRPGEQVRGATDAADRAYWIAVLRPTADGGTADAGPRAGATVATPATDAGTDAGSGTTSPTAGTPSPPPPEIPPIQPKPAPPPPAGPGPVGPGPVLPAPH